MFYLFMDCLACVTLKNVKVLTPESPEAAIAEKQKIEAAATTLQRRFRQIATAKREAVHLLLCAFDSSFLWAFSLQQHC